MQPAVGGSAHVDVVVDVDELACEAVAQESRDEQRRVADAAQQRVARLAIGAVRGGREQQRQRLQARPGLALVVQRFVPREQRQQIDDVVSGVIVGRDALLGHGGLDGVLEELLQTRDGVNSIVCARKHVSRILGAALPHTTAEHAACFRV